MISPQARFVRLMLKSSTSRTTYSNSSLSRHRDNFESNLKTLFPANRRVTTTDTTVAGVKVTEVTAANSKERTILYLHGGGFVLGSTDSYQQHLARLASLCNAKVLAIDYALSPENPYPVALNQIKAVWKELLKQGLDTTKTVIMGDSAGGNLTMATALRFREDKLPQPACLVLISPALDATFSGPSYVSKIKREPLLNMQKLNFFMESYVQGGNKKDPFVSPIFANLKGLPPFLIHVGSEELMLSDSETITEHAKRDGAQGQLYVGKGMWHGWHIFAAYVPEAKQAMQAIAQYVTAQTSTG